MRARLGAVAAFGLLLATAACSAGTGPMSSPSASGTSARPSPLPASPSLSTSPSSSPGGASQLTIVVDDGTGTTTTWTLTCDPVGGTHPDAEQACAALQNHGEALDPVPKEKMCAQVYSGPEQATITGTWLDEEVSASLSRINSCETARWDALVPLVPAGGR